jgi:LysM repeat protein
MARQQTEEHVSLPRRSLDTDHIESDNTEALDGPARLASRLVVPLAAATAIALLPAQPAQAAPAPTTAVSAVAVQTRSQGTPWPGHPGRALVRHTVRPGDTATGLAVRFHAWTAELVSLNQLGSGGTLRRGQVLRIPVVLSAVRRAGGQAPQLATKPAKQGRGPGRHLRAHHRKHAQVQVLIHSSTPPTRRWRHDAMTRTQVRRLVAAMARHYGVPPRLALAIAWQESGWQQHRVSKAGAIGVMQVMPATGRWMRWYAGRPLRLRDTHDNIQAGILTLRILRSWTTYDDNAIAAYYQGLGAVRRHGHFKQTKHYVASVRAHERKLARTGNPV